MSKIVGPLSDFFACGACITILLGTVTAVGDKDIVFGACSLVWSVVLALLSIAYSIKESK